MAQFYTEYSLYIAVINDYYRICLTCWLHNISASSSCLSGPAAGLQLAQLGVQAGTAKEVIIKLQLQLFIAVCFDITTIAQNPICKTVHMLATWLAKQSLQSVWHKLRLLE